MYYLGASANHNYAAIEWISFLSICYMCTCAYYTIFRVRVLNYYYLASNHQSDEYTLLFSGFYIIFKYQNVSISVSSILLISIWERYIRNFHSDFWIMLNKICVINPFSLMLVVWQSDLLSFAFMGVVIHHNNNTNSILIF